MLTHATNGNGHTGKPRADEGHAAGQPGYAQLLSEAQALRDALHDACGRCGRLVAALKRHRRESRLVMSTLASLKQLHHIGG